MIKTVSHVKRATSVKSVSKSNFLAKYICQCIPNLQLLHIQRKGNNNNSIQFQFINVPNQQPEGQLQKQHNVETQITTDNIQNKNKTNTTKTNK